LNNPNFNIGHIRWDVRLGLQLSLERNNDQMSLLFFFFFRLETSSTLFRSLFAGVGEKASDHAASSSVEDPRFNFMHHR